jgi:hypothetical protein
MLQIINDSRRRFYTTQGKCLREKDLWSGEERGGGRGEDIGLLLCGHAGDDGCDIG